MSYAVGDRVVINQNILGFPILGPLVGQKGVVDHLAPSVWASPAAFVVAITSISQYLGLHYRIDEDCLDPVPVAASTPVAKYKVGDFVVTNAAAAAFWVKAGLKLSVSGVVPGLPTNYYVKDTMSTYYLTEGCLDPVAPAASPEVKLTAAGRCSFCGGDGVMSKAHDSGLRCQAEPWAFCARVGCFESIALHVSRLEAGLFDTPETRAATRAWYLAKSEREKRIP